MTDTPMTRAEVLDLVAKARAAGQRADLRGADLRGANLRGADLQDADLQGAVLPLGWHLTETGQLARDEVAR